MELVGKCLLVKMLSLLACFNSVHAFIEMFQSTDPGAFFSTVFFLFRFRPFVSICRGTI